MIDRRRDHDRVHLGVGEQLLEVGGRPRLSGGPSRPRPAAPARGRTASAARPACRSSGRGSGPSSRARRARSAITASRPCRCRSRSNRSRCAGRRRAAPARPGRRSRRPECAVTITTQSAAAGSSGSSVRPRSGQLRHVRVVVRRRRASASWSSSIIFEAGDSRVSSMSALYETPRMSTFEPLSAFSCVVQRARDLAEAPVRHVLVDLARELDELGVEVVLARLPRQVEGVDRHAVAAQPRARAGSS